MSYTYAFEKLTVWQMNRVLAKKLYLKTKSFPKEELFGITSQIRRACISVSCNLAEGSARKTPKEQLRFYEIAFASGAEVVCLLILCNDLEMLSDNDFQELRADVEKITFQINNLSRGLSGS